MEACIQMYLHIIQFQLYVNETAMATLQGWWKIANGSMETGKKQEILMQEREYDLVETTKWWNLDYVNSGVILRLWDMRILVITIQKGCWGTGNYAEKNNIDGEALLEAKSYETWL